MVSEPASIRAGLALKHGATQVLDPTKGEGPASVFEATSGTGVDMVFDCAGVQASITAGLKSLRPRGTFVNVALWEDLPQVDLNLLAFREITIIGIFGSHHLSPGVDLFEKGIVAYDRIHAELLEIVAAGKITGIEELITSKIAIEDVVEHGFLALLQKDTQGVPVHPQHTFIANPRPSQNPCTSISVCNLATVIRFGFLLYTSYQGFLKFYAASGRCL